MTVGEAAVAAARGAIGSRFRLHGRAPEWGLDCVGLVLLSARAAGFAGDAPADYPMRGRTGDSIAALMDLRFRRVDRAEPGDAVLFEAGPAQMHLGIVTETGLVHADAGLRRVVERPGVAPWPVIACWRLGEK